MTIQFYEWDGTMPIEGSWAWPWHLALGICWHMARTSIPEDAEPVFGRWDDAR